MGTAAQELVITTAGNTPGNALTINSLLGNTTGAFTKAGDGTLILTGANTFTGSTFINGGTIQLSGTTATLGTISTAANVTTIRQNATLDINAAGATATLYAGGPSYPVVTIGALAGAGTVTNSGGGTGAQATLNIRAGDDDDGGGSFLRPAAGWGVASSM
ncbi:MAG: autotransporter-associated beta strand repeat-containing protein [Chthoniobacter sp.]